MMRGVRIGELDRKITFQEKVITTDEYNADNTTWQDVATVWASIKHMTADEVHDAEKDTYIVPVVATIRYRTDLTQEMQFVYNGMTYEIKSIIEPIGFRKTLLEIKGIARK